MISHKSDLVVSTSLLLHYCHMYAVDGVLGTLVLGNVLKRSIVLAPEKNVLFIVVPFPD